MFAGFVTDPAFLGVVTFFALEYFPYLQQVTFFLLPLSFFGGFLLCHFPVFLLNHFSCLKVLQALTLYVYFVFALSFLSVQVFVLTRLMSLPFLQTAQPFAPFAFFQISLTELDETALILVIFGFPGLLSAEDGSGSTKLKDRPTKIAIRTGSILVVMRLASILKLLALYYLR